MSKRGTRTPGRAAPEKRSAGNKGRGQRAASRAGARARTESARGAGLWSAALRGLLSRLEPPRQAVLRLRLGRALARVPRAAWICALVAALNACCWSLLTPPFEAPDEPSHYAYVKQLAETGTLPTSGSGHFSYEETFTLVGLRQYLVKHAPPEPAIGSRAEQSQLTSDLQAASRAHQTGSPAAGVATAEPPLYYAVEAIPYTLAGGTVLDRLQLMRLLSALMAGLTAMFAFLFVRETLPGEPWAWSVGGLAVALAPLLGFISGAVNPDALLLAVSAALFYAFARAMRRGFSTDVAIAIGGLTAVGLLTKLNFIGFLPGIALGLCLLTIRGLRASPDRRAYRRLALAAGIGLSPVLLHIGVHLLANHASLELTSGATIKRATDRPLAELNYIWQLYLPHIPGTANDFPGMFTTRQLWFDGYVGLYGWLDTTFPTWVYNAALVPAAAIALLCGRALYRGRGALRDRVPELAVYATLAVGLLTLVGAASYREFPASEASFFEPRYTLPLLALIGAALALAARGAGRRWGPTAGVLIVLLFLAHDVFSQLLVLARYYG